MRHRVCGAFFCALASLVAACGSMPTCKPVSVTVAQKEERTRMDMAPRGVVTSPTGRVEELLVPEQVREYWVRAEDGTWYRVSPDRFRAVEVGGSAEICR